MFTCSFTSLTADCNSRVEVGKCLVLCIAGTLTPFIICSVPFTGLWGQYGYEEGTGDVSQYGNLVRLVIKL